MKKIAFLVAAISMLVTACKKEPAPPIILKVDGTPMPKGTPTGTILAKTIGSTGGSITSADSGITIIIPAGAVTSNTEFSIQPIINTAPNGIGTSYLLLPEGKRFNKPVSIQFKYTDDQIEGTFPQALFIAYQDTAGIWNASGVPQVDTVNKTVTVTSQHFSRWAQFANTILFVDKPSIDVNEVANLSVLEVMKKPSTNINILAQSGAYIPLNAATSDDDETEWLPVTQGNLNHSDNTATYKAPPSTPSPNPVTIKAIVNRIIAPLNSPPSVTLRRKIYISSSFLEVILDGNTNIYPSAEATISNGSIQIAAYNQASNGATISPALSDTGSVVWGTGNKSKVVFSVGGITFSNSYVECQPSVHNAITTGTISITKWPANKGDYVEGEYHGEVIHQDTYRYCNPIRKSIYGRFRAKRSW